MTASTIMGLENVLDQADGWPDGSYRERVRDPLLYWLIVFGEPGSDQPGRGASVVTMSPCST